MAETTKTTRKTPVKKASSSSSTPVEAKTASDSLEGYRIRTIEDSHTVVPVINGFHGRLIYISSRTGEKFVWENYGDVQEMELGELRNMRTTAKRFYEDNWIVFDDPAIIAALGVEQYYKHMILPQNADAVFEKSPAEIKKEIAQMSKGQKESFKFFVREKIADGSIDSLKTIRALEEALGTLFIEDDK